MLCVMRSRCRMSRGPRCPRAAQAWGPYLQPKRGDCQGARAAQGEDEEEHRRNRVPDGPERRCKVQEGVGAPAHSGEGGLRSGRCRAGSRARTSASIPCSAAPQTAQRALQTRPPHAGQRDPGGERLGHEDLAQAQRQRVEADVQDDRHHELGGGERGEGRGGKGGKSDQLVDARGGGGPRGARTRGARSNGRSAPCRSCTRPRPSPALHKCFASGGRGHTQVHQRVMAASRNGAQSGGQAAHPPPGVCSCLHTLHACAPHPWWAPVARTAAAASPAGQGSGGKTRPFVSAGRSSSKLNGAEPRCKPRAAPRVRAPG